jgi:hypothetical protein
MKCLLLGFGTFENSSKMGRVLCCQQCYLRVFGSAVVAAVKIKSCFKMCLVNANRIFFHVDPT